MCDRGGSGLSIPPSKIDKAVAGIMAAIEDGLYQPVMKARMTHAPQPIPTIHPNIADAYRRRVERLAETLKDPETRQEAADAIRSLIGKVMLHPVTSTAESAPRFMAN